MANNSEEGQGSQRAVVPVVVMMMMMNAMQCYPHLIMVVGFECF
jgi:hypothetical protein